MQQMLEAVDLLRGRFTRLRGKRSNVALEEEIGVHRNTLTAFLRGGSINLATLYTIEAWCEKQEGLSHDNA